LPSRTSRAHREIEILRRVTEVVEEAHDEADLVAALCQTVHERGGFPLVWFGYADPLPPQRVAPVAMRGPAVGYLEGVDIRWSDTPEGRGPTGTAIRESRVVVVRSLRNDPNFGPWRERARGFGLESSAAIPVITGGTVVGALNVYSHLPDAFDATEVTLLETLGRLSGLGLQRVRERPRRVAPASGSKLRAALDTGILELFPEMVFVHRADGPVVAVNDLVLSAYRCTREDIFRGDPTQFSGVPEAAPRVLQAVHEAAAGVPVDLPRWVSRRKDGTTFPCEVRLRRLDFPGSEEGPYVLAFVRDTSREQALRRDELEAHRADTVTELAGALAHDFNNLLTSLGGYLDAALDAPSEDGPRARAALEAARDATRRAEDLTRHIQRLGHPRPLRPRPCSLAEAVGTPARFAAHGVGTTLHLSLDEALGPVLADPSAVERVVHNLVLNAAQATGPQGNIWIHARAVEPPPTVAAGAAQLRRDTRASVEIQVDDDGPGVPPEDRARIFTPRFTTKSDGTGLGLASSQRLARRLGGALRYSPSPRGGARFTLVLPHADAVTDADERLVGDADADDAHTGPDGETDGPPRAPSPSLGGTAATSPTAAWGPGAPSPSARLVPVAGPSPRLLLVEDDEALRAAMVRLLRHGGFAPSVVSSGAEALAAAREARAAGTPFEVAVLALSLAPGGSQGTTLLTQLREPLPGLGAVVCSAWADAPEMLRPRAHGFDAAVPKPFRHRQLQEAVTTALFRRRNRVA